MPDWAKYALGAMAVVAAWGASWGVQSYKVDAINKTITKCDFPSSCEQIHRNEKAIDKLSDKMDKSTARIIDAIERLAP